MNKAQKLVKMIDLMSRRGGVMSSELKERFDLDARTLRRYLADLRDIEIPLIDEGRGEDRLISVDPKWRRTGLQLSLPEVLSLHFGRTLYDFLDGTRFTQDLEGALERLEPAISRAHSDLARQLDARFLAVPEPAKNYRGNAARTIDELVTAVVYNNPVQARYRKPSGVERTYVLHPYTLATFRQGLYIFAHDVDAAAVKTYAVERFVECVRRGAEQFSLPEDWRPSAHIAHAFGIISGDPVDVAIAFAERVRHYVRERTWHPTQSFATLPDGRLVLSMRVALTVELQTWVLGFGADAQALEPPALVQGVRRSLQGAIAQYPEP